MWYDFCRVCCAKPERVHQVAGESLSSGMWIRRAKPVWTAGGTRPPRSTSTPSHLIPSLVNHQLFKGTLESARTGMSTLTYFFFFIIWLGKMLPWYNYQVTWLQMAKWSRTFHCPMLCQSCKGFVKFVSKVWLMPTVGKLPKPHFLVLLNHVLRQLTNSAP